MISVVLTADDESVVGALIFVSAGDEADSLAPEKSLNWGTDMLVVSGN